MTKYIKRAASVLATCILALSICFVTACTGTAGINGKDGSDVTISGIYQEYVNTCYETNDTPLSFLDFLKEYLGVVSQEAEEAVSLQSIINRSLLSSVSILATFTTDGTSSTYVGSGVIVDIEEGGNAYIVTNSHVVINPNSTGSTYSYCNSLNIFLYGNDVNGTDYTISSGVVKNINGISSSYIQLIGCSASYDIAVLKVTNSPLLAERYSAGTAIAAKFSEEDEVYAGESVYAIGDPSGSGLSATTGVISRDSENISLTIGGTKGVYRVIRTDAAINGGNSGGGLFNTSGELVGIVNSKNESDGIDNIAYALPSSYVRRIVQSMIDSYKSDSTAKMYVKTAVLGITTTVAQTSLEYDGGNVIINETVRVSSVSKGYAASGILKEGDVIKSFSIGTLTSASSDSSTTTGGEGCYLYKLSGFSVPEDDNTVAKHYFTIDVTRSYMVEDAMFSAREGDWLELVIERDTNTYYAYIHIEAGDFYGYS